MSDAPLPVPPASNNNKKFLIFGCGGCLVIVLIGALVFLALGWMGCNMAMKLSNESVQTIFGEGYDPGKSGYIAIGIPGMGNPELGAAAALINQNTGILLAAVELNADPNQEGSAEEASAEGYMEQASSYMGGTELAGVNMQNMQMDDMRMVKLANGKAFMLMLGKVSTNKDQQYSPAAMALLPLHGNRMVILIASATKTKADDSNADFAPQYQQLEQEISRAVTEGTLDDRLNEEELGDMSDMEGGMDLKGLRESLESLGQNGQVDMERLQKMSEEMERYAQEYSNQMQDGGKAYH